MDRVRIMTSRKTSFDTVRRIGLALADVEESTAYAMPALKVRGKLLATLPANRSAEPNSLVVRVSFEQRSELLNADPAVYYITEHYEGYDGVLVRLSIISPEGAKGTTRNCSSICDPQANQGFSVKPLKSSVRGFRQ
jgi:hypothetical protein